MAGLIKAATILGGILVGGTILAIVIGITGGMIVVGVLALTLLIRRDWVPTIYNVRSLGVRRWTTALTAGGLALTVGVFTAVLMLTEGVHETLKTTGSADNAKIIRKGSQNEVQSGVQPEHLRLLSSAPEVAVGRDGKPLASPELLVIIFAQREDAKSEEDGTNLNVRGVGPTGLELHPPVALEGRMFTPGTSEIVIGKGLQGRFRGMQLGDRTRFARRDWTVVGVLALTLLIRRDWVPTIYNVRSLGVRRWTTALTAGGLALTVGVFTAVLMLTEGVHETLKTTGSADNAKIIRKGS
ncbi:MAG TPA: ABC transporter permease, partial [Polyangia bacterium]